MEEILKSGYTLTLSGLYGNICGGYLKVTSRGMQPIWRFPEEEVKIVESFPNVFSALRENRTLQLYYSYGNFVGIIGKKHFEFPYAEEEYLAVEGVSCSDSAILALADLNSQLIDTKDEVRQYVKAYKFYGSDKYQLESVGEK